MTKKSSEFFTVSATLSIGVLALWAGILPQKSAYALTDAEIFMLKGPDRQRVLLDGAAKEGRVVFYSEMIVNQAMRPIAEAFGRKYPAVKAEYWRGTTTAIIQKVLNERRANAIASDVVEGGGLAIPLIKGGALSAFQSPELEGYPEGYRDPDNLWGPSRISYFGMAYNTRQVSESEAPNTYEALLDPRWKGNIAWHAGGSQGASLFIGNIMASMGNKGEDYLRKLGQQQIVNYADSARALVDRVGQGEYMMAINIFAHHPLISAAQGAPLDVKMMQPIASNMSTVHLTKGGPHPHAAMLFVDFILSRDGQGVLRDAEYLPVHPQVEPGDSIKRIVPRLIGAKETVFTPQRLSDSQERANGLFDKYFK